MKRSKTKSEKLERTSREPASEHASTTNTPFVPTRSRRWLFRLTAGLLIPLLVLLGLEAVLRLAGYGYDPDFFVRWRIGDEDFLVQNDDFSRRFFPPQTLRHPGALRMKAEKPEDTIRIFILGESAAMGDPEPAYGPARYMEVLLRQRCPDVDFEIVNVAFTAINSHVILPIARECARHEGDLWIIYMGNNEMVGPFGASSAFGSQAPPIAQVRASVALRGFRFGQLIDALARSLRGSSSDYETWGGMQMFIENQVTPGDPRRDVVGVNFNHNLHDIVEAGLDADAKVLLCTVAVNLKDSPPFASMLNTNLSATDQEAFQQRLTEARAAVAGSNLVLSIQRYTEAAGLDPTFAEVQYELGSLLFQQSNVVAARDRFQKACDSDALTFRTDSHLNAVIRDVAGGLEHPNLQLLDTGSELASLAGVPINGQESFYEHVHFNFDGAYRLGLVWAKHAEAMLGQQLRDRSALAWASQKDCERRLCLTEWNRVLVLQSMISRLRKPPLSSQPNNDARIGVLQASVKELRGGLNAEAVASGRLAFTEALARAPEDHLIHELRGNFLQSVGDLEGATAAWRRAHALIPHDFLAPFQIGVLLARQGQRAEAERWLREALRTRPALIEGWIELGHNYTAQKQADLAVHAYDQALGYSPGDPRLLAFKGKAMYSAGRIDDAIEFYRQALEANPRSIQARIALVDALVASGRVADAIRELESVLEGKPGLLNARLNLGVLLVKQGRLDAARASFQEVLNQDPENKGALDYLDQLQRHLETRP